MGSTDLVLLDLDGTLLDESRLPAAMRRTCAAVAARVGGVDAEDLYAANHAVWGTWWPEVEDEWMLGGARGGDLTAEAWRRTLARCGITDPAAAALAQDTWTEEALAAHRLFPDTLPLLDALAAAGVRAGLVSNGAADLQRAKLAVTGLADRLDPVVVSGRAGTRKPGAEIFEIALAAAGAPAARTLFVGDNLTHDVPGAVAAGIRAVWLDRDAAGPYPEAPVPSATVRSLLDLLPLIDLLDQQESADTPPRDRSAPRVGGELLNEDVR